MSNRGGKIVTANHLLGGHVVYLTEDAAWTTELQDAALAADRDIAAQLLNIALDHIDRVVGPYLVDVVRTNHAIEPSRTRERLRAAGPFSKADKTPTAS